MRHVGVEQVHSRPIWFFQLSDWAWEEPETPCPFTLLVAVDASADDEPAIRRFAGEAVASGCSYVCTWGRDCERVHDLFDEASVAASRFVMSTSHADEQLYEALYFALVLAVPEESPEAGGAPVVLAVDESWVSEVRRLVADQAELARLWVSEE